MLAPDPPHQSVRFAVVVKGYPRLSETFIAQELLALQERGYDFDIWSLRQPTDGALHSMHRAIRQKAQYLPEYLYLAPFRVMAGLGWSLSRPGFWSALSVFARDLWREPTANLGRRFGQACVFARELDAAIGHVHVHYLHTPASVVRYAALIRGFTWSFSAHAKDIWTTPDWEKREKIAASQWGVTCTRENHAALTALAPDRERVALAYHGLDLRRFPDPPSRVAKDGSRVAEPMRIVSVGRAVDKKGFDVLLRALSLLPAQAQWRFVHIGAGEKLSALRALAADLGLSERVEFRGAQPQDKVIDALREADIFALACKPGENGDQDGLPNVMLEAATQALPIVSTDFAAVPEFIQSGIEGVLVPHSDPDAFAGALARLIADPAERAAMGQAGFAKLRRMFSFEAGLDAIEVRLSGSLTRAALRAARR